MVVATNTFVQDTVLTAKAVLVAGVTDPNSSTRPSGQSFIFTSYPSKPVTYPIITIKTTGPADEKRLGARSSLKWVRLPLEVRVWAKSEKVKDDLTQDVYNALRSKQFGTSSTSDTNGMHDFELVSSVPVEEEGQDGVKSMVMTYNYKVLVGT